MATETRTRKDVYAIINEQIIAQLEKGTVPWLKPWHDGGLPQNAVSKKYYRGINILLLAWAGYENNQFLTFKQLTDMGAKVKRDEKGHMVVFWKFPEKDQTGEAGEEDEKSKAPVLRYYTVFNVSQCENLPDKYVSTTREAVLIPSCESIVENMPKRPEVRSKEQRAFYNPLQDFVNMPKKTSFKSDESYYSTLFHELVHSTGHHSRLKRPGLIQMSEFGDEAYSLEELVAEIGTCYLQSVAGIESEFNQSAAYIQGWLSRMRGDRHLIFSASSMAQKAVDFILNAGEHDEIAEE